VDWHLGSPIKKVRQTLTDFVDCDSPPPPICSQRNEVGTFFPVLAGLQVPQGKWIRHSHSIGTSKRTTAAPSRHLRLKESSEVFQLWAHFAGSYQLYNQHEVLERFFPLVRANFEYFFHHGTPFLLSCH
jgi:hypothetical protein